MSPTVAFGLTPLDGTSPSCRAARGVPDDPVLERVAGHEDEAGHVGQILPQTLNAFAITNANRMSAAENLQ